jgi:type VI secretion system protein ImpJ
MSSKAPQRVVWSEGLLMSPQHLQQLDLYHERLLGARLDAVESLNFGVLASELDRRVLSSGQVQLNGFRGVMPDGAVLDLEPGHPELPKMRPVGEHFPHTQQVLEVFLALPREREGIDNYAQDGERPARYRSAARAVRDMTAPQQSVELAFGQRNLMLLFGDEALNDYVAIKIAEIVRDDGGGLVVSDPYIPPCLRIDGSPFLISGLRRLLQTMTTRHKALAEARRQSSTSTIEFSATDVTRYLLLSTINGFIPPLQHMVESGDLPPRTVYLTLGQLAGQLCTFAVDADPTRLPKFAYNDLRSTFEELFARVTSLLLATVGEHFVAIPLQAQNDGMHVAKLEDERLATCDRFLISVKTDLPEKQVAAQLPQFAKVASWTDIQEILAAATPGAAVEVTYRPPPEIPIKAGLVYFTITVDNAYWRKILSERKIAVYLPPFFEPTRTSVELMAVPRRVASGPPPSRRA